MLLIGINMLLNKNLEHPPCTDLKQPVMDQHDLHTQAWFR